MKTFEYGLHIESLGWLANCDVDLVLRCKSELVFTNDKELALTFDSEVDNPQEF